MESEAVDRVAALLLAAFETKIATLEHECPMPSAKLDNQLTLLSRVLFEEFDLELQDCVLRELRLAKRNELNRHVVSACARLHTTNTQRIMERMRDVVHGQLIALKANFEAWCDSKFPLKDVSLIDTQYSAQRLSAQQAIEFDLGLLRADALSSDAYRAQIDDLDASLKELIMLKSMQNEAMLKDARIDELNQRVLAQQEQLIATSSKLEQYLASEQSTTKLLTADLTKLRDEKEAESRRAQQAMARFERQKQELEMLRQRKSKCVIL